MIPELLFFKLIPIELLLNLLFRMITPALPSTLIPQYSSKEDLPEFSIINPSIKTLPAVTNTTLPLEQALIEGKLIPLNRMDLDMITFSLYVPSCTSMVSPEVARFMASFILLIF